MTPLRTLLWAPLLCAACSASALSDGPSTPDTPDSPEQDRPDAPSGDAPAMAPELEHPDAPSGDAPAMAPELEHPDAPSGDAPIAVPPGACTSAALDPAAVCPSTYTAAISAFVAQACRLDRPITFAGPCGGVLGVALWAGTHWSLCTYGTADGSPPVGTASMSDYPEFCGGTSPLVRAGNVPDACVTLTTYVSDALTPIDAGTTCPPSGPPGAVEAGAD